MTFTKEQLINQAREEVAFWRERDELIPSQQTAIRLRLAEITLAALDTPHVGYLDSDYADLLKSGSVESCSVYAEPGEGFIAVYTAQPAPVSVPDESAMFEAAIDICRKSDAIDEHAWNRGVLAVMSAFRACRAAMLQGAEPVQKWIPCNERMPEAGQKVLAYRPDAPESDDPLVRMATYVGRSPHGHGSDCYWKPSHWMPLPAAPQQH